MNGRRGRHRWCNYQNDMIMEGCERRGEIKKWELEKETRRGVVREREGRTRYGKEKKIIRRRGGADQRRNQNLTLNSSLK